MLGFTIVPFTNTLISDVVNSELFIPLAVSVIFIGIVTLLLFISDELAAPFNSIFGATVSLLTYVVFVSLIFPALSIALNSISKFLSTVYVIEPTPFVIAIALVVHVPFSFH